MIIDSILPAFQQQTSQSDKLDDWLYENIQPFIKPRVLVIGKKNSFADLLIHHSISFHFFPPVGCDISTLKVKYAESDLVRSIKHYQIDFESIDKNARDAFGTVIIHPDIDHHFKSADMLKDSTFFLRPHGHLILSFPSSCSPYTGVELSLAEWKMYDYMPITRLLSNYSILRMRHFSIDSVTYVLVVAKKIK